MKIIKKQSLHTLQTYIDRNNPLKAFKFRTIIDRTFSDPNFLRQNSVASIIFYLQWAIHFNTLSVKMWALNYMAGHTRQLHRRSEVTAGNLLPQLNYLTLVLYLMLFWSNGCGQTEQGVSWSVSELSKELLSF